MSDVGERGLDITALGPYFLHSSVASNLFQNKGILKFKTVENEHRIFSSKSSFSTFFPTMFHFVFFQERKN